MKLNRKHKLLIFTQLFVIIFKGHFFLGSVYGTLELPLLILSIITLLLVGIQKSTKYYIFYASTLTFFLVFSFNRIPRLTMFETSHTTEKVKIHSCNLFFKNRHKQNIVNEILNAKSDVVVVQELTYEWQNTLNKKLSSKYPYKSLKPHNGTWGLGVYSKFPISKTDYLEQSQLVKIRIKNKDLILVNSHLASPAIAIENPNQFFSLFKKNSKTRHQQWNNLENHLEKEYSGLPIVIAGDLNTMQNESLYRNIRLNWNDLLAKKGSLFNHTFPNTHTIKTPFITLDYILYNDFISGINGKVLTKSSSDHLSIVGVIEF